MKENLPCPDKNEVTCLSQELHINLYMSLYPPFRSAFFLYSNEERSKVKAVNPEWGIGKIAQVLAEQWRNVSPAQRAKFDKAAIQDKDRYIKVSSTVSY